MGNVCACITEKNGSQLRPAKPNSLKAVAPEYRDDIEKALAEARAELDAGKHTLFDDVYQTGRIIGHGAFAKVQVCTHHKTGQEFAVKTVHKTDDLKQREGACICAKDTVMMTAAICECHLHVCLPGVAAVMRECAAAAGKVAFLIPHSSWHGCRHCGRRGRFHWQWVAATGRPGRARVGCAAAGCGASAPAMCCYALLLELRSCLMTAMPTVMHRAATQSHSSTSRCYRQAYRQCKLMSRMPGGQQQQQQSSGAR